MTTIALIGFGYWGPNYARILSQLGRVKLKWICDLDTRVLQQAAIKFPSVSITKNINSVLSDREVQGVVIATPATTHAALIETALKMDKHVLVEKPMTTNLFEATKLFELAKRKKHILLIGHTYLYHPVIRELRKLISSGSLGRLLFFIGQRLSLSTSITDVNVLWDLGPHEVSTLLYLTSGKIASVNATGSRYKPGEPEYMVNLNLTLKDRTFANFLLSWLSPVKVRSLTIVGEKCMVVFDEMSPHAQLKIIEGTMPMFTKGKVVTFTDFQKIFLHSRHIKVPILARSEPLKLQVTNFIQAITKNSPLEVSPGDAIYTLKVLEAAQKSMTDGKTIYL